MQWKDNQSEKAQVEPEAEINPHTSVIYYNSTYKAYKPIEN